MTDIVVRTYQRKDGTWRAVARFKGADGFTTEATRYSVLEQVARQNAHRDVLDLLRITNRFSDVVDREEGMTA